MGIYKMAPDPQGTTVIVLSGRERLAVNDGAERTSELAGQAAVPRSVAS